MRFLIIALEILGLRVPLQGDQDVDGVDGERVSADRELVRGGVKSVSNDVLKSSYRRDGIRGATADFIDLRDLLLL